MISPPLSTSSSNASGSFGLSSISPEVSEERTPDSEALPAEESESFESFMPPNTSRAEVPTETSDTSFLAGTKGLSNLAETEALSSATPEQIFIEQGDQDSEPPKQRNSNANPPQSIASRELPKETETPLAGLVGAPLTKLSPPSNGNPVTPTKSIPRQPGSNANEETSPIQRSNSKSPVAISSLTEEESHQTPKPLPAQTPPSKSPASLESASDAPLRQEILAHQGRSSRQETLDLPHLEKPTRSSEIEKKSLQSLEKPTFQSNQDLTPRSGIPPAQQVENRPIRASHESATIGSTKEMNRNLPSTHLKETPVLPRAVSPVEQGVQANTGPRPASIENRNTEGLPTLAGTPSFSTVATGTESNFSQKLVPPTTVQSNVDQIHNLIKEQAITLKRFSHDSLTAEIRPDSKTTITLSLQNTSDGIMVSAQLDAKNTEWLKANWSQLQARLAEQNITLEDPRERSSNHSNLSDERSTNQGGRQNLTQHSPTFTHTERKTETDEPLQSGSKSESNEKVYWA